MKRLHLFLAAFVLALLTVCASLGIPDADTFNKKAMVAHGTVAAIAKSATSLRAAGKLSDADRDNIVATLKNAEMGIDMATMVGKTDPAAGVTKLDTSIAVLTALQAYLLTKEK